MWVSDALRKVEGFLVERHVPFSGSRTSSRRKRHRGQSLEGGKELEKAWVRLLCVLTPDPRFWSRCCPDLVHS